MSWHRNLLVFTLAVICALPAAAQGNSLDAASIVQNLARNNERRAANLKSYSVLRHYEVHYRGFPGSKDAEMDVRMRYVAPATKQFEVISQSGSKYLIDHVLRKLLTSEEEALTRENRSETAMTAANYNFALLGEENTPEGHFYILKTEPKRKNKFLFRGTIWVDAGDFAIARIEAEPAKNPSFWISKTRIEHKYEKLGEFWLPLQNNSLTSVRLGGTATLTIQYRNYQIENGAADSVANEERNRSSEFQDN
jgi:outer membrane lipoprotein-sorting protein